MWWQMNWYSNNHYNYFVQNYSFSNSNDVNVSYDDSGSWKMHLYKIYNSETNQNNNQWSF